VNSEAQLAQAIMQRQSNILLSGHIVLTGQFANGTNLLPSLQVPTTVTVRPRPTPPALSFAAELMFRRCCRCSDLLRPLSGPPPLVHPGFQAASVAIPREHPAAAAAPRAVPSLQTSSLLRV
jgi:hypothetical protein